MEIEDGEDFVVWLRSRMAARRMSQRRLAALSGVDHATICRVVGGDRSPSLDTVSRLVRALGVPSGKGHAAACLMVVERPTDDRAVSPR